MPIGKLHLMPDFLPAPKDLLPKSQKITLTLDKNTIDFFRKLWYDAPMKMKYYCYCPVCNDSDKAENFFAKAGSLAEAKEKLELHEKDLHKGKLCGTFGKGLSYPKGM